MTFHFRLIRRAAFNQAGGIDESFDSAEDYDLCLRLAEVAEVQQVKKPLYYYRHHKKSLSQQKQVEQILSSKKAIAQALERRGLSDHLEIDVQIRGQFSLRRKESSSLPAID